MNGYDEKNGARPMGRLIDRQIRRKLADEILFGKLQGGGNATVKVEGDELVIAATPWKSETSKAASEPVEV